MVKKISKGGVIQEKNHPAPTGAEGRTRAGKRLKNCSGGRKTGINLKNNTVCPQFCQKIIYGKKKGS